MGRSGVPAELVGLADERTRCQEHATRQVGHLMRELDYGYPPVQIRACKRQADHAVKVYIKSCEAFDRAARAIRKADS